MENIPLQNKKIIVKSHKIESGVSASGVAWKRVDIITEENGKDIKFSFFTKKQDGSPTKAMEYYTKNLTNWTNSVMTDQPIKVEIAYSEEEYEYQNKKGERKIGKRRNIKMFRDIEEKDPLAEDPFYAGMYPTDDDLHI